MTRKFRSAAKVAAGVGAVATTVVAALGTTGPAAAAPTQAATTCSTVDVSFARGSAELPGVGIAGQPFIASLTSQVSPRTVSTYAVNYAADVAQTSAAAGSTDLVNHLTSVTQSCPNTQLVIGGYSQGATVVDKALGIRTNTGGIGGTVIPAAVASKVVAVVAFGNPLGLQRATINSASPTYASRAMDICTSGDPVCGGGFNFFAHLSYGFNGSTTRAATFAASKIG